MSLVSTTGDVSVVKELFRGLMSKELFATTTTGNGTTLFHRQAQRGPAVIEEGVLSFLLKWMSKEDILAEDYSGKTALDVFVSTTPGANGVLERALKLAGGDGVAVGFVLFSPWLVSPCLALSRLALPCLVFLWCLTLIPLLPLSCLALSLLLVSYSSHNLRQPKSGTTFSSFIAKPEASRKRSLATFEDVWAYVEKTFAKEIEDEARKLSCTY